MKSRIDLHVHSKYSGDTDAEPEEIIHRALDLGLDGIAFTEHYSYAASEPIEALKEKYGARIMIFRGVEFSAAEGHCLVFGADTDGLCGSYAPVGELVKLVNRRGGVVIPSHPYRKGNSLGELVEAVQGICAIEGYNGNNMQSYNERAVESARKLDLRFTGGSDAHEAKEVGSCYTEFDDVVTYETFLETLKRGSYRGVDTRKVSSLFGFLK